MRGGGTKSCELTGQVGKQTSVGSSKVVTILEDELRVASPEQIICYGDTFTTCQTLTIVMEDNWKVGVHLNSAMFLRYDNGTTYNPVTLIPILKTLLSTHPKYKDSNIKAIYLVTSLSSSVLSKDPGANIFFEMINNSNSMARLQKNQRKVLRNEFDGDDLLKSFFRQVFPGKVTDTTFIYDGPNKQVQHGVALEAKAYVNDNIPNDRKLQHFFIFEDGTLELVTNNSGMRISPE